MLLLVYHFKTGVNTSNSLPRVALASAEINPQLLVKCSLARIEFVLLAVSLSPLEFNRTAVALTIHTMATLRLNRNA